MTKLFSICAIAAMALTLWFSMTHSILLGSSYSSHRTFMELDIQEDKDRLKHVQAKMPSNIELFYSAKMLPNTDTMSELVIMAYIVDGKDAFVAKYPGTIDDLFEKVDVERFEKEPPQALSLASLEGIKQEARHKYRIHKSNVAMKMVIDIYEENEMIDSTSAYQLRKVLYQLPEDVSRRTIFKDNYSFIQHILN